MIDMTRGGERVWVGPAGTGVLDDERGEVWALVVHWVHASRDAQVHSATLRWETWRGDWARGTRFGRRHHAIPGWALDVLEERLERLTRERALRRGRGRPADHGGDVTAGRRR